MRILVPTLLACGLAFVAGRAIPQSRGDESPTAMEAAAAAAPTTSASSPAGAPATASPASPERPHRPAPRPRDGTIAAASVAPAESDASAAYGTTIVGGDALPSEWVTAVRHTPGPAAAIRNAVVSAVAKRGDPYAIRDCLAAAGIHERTELRFTIDVVARATSVDITGATFVEVIDGPGISDEAARCLEAELSGSDHVLGEGFLDGYTGRIPYIQTYAPRPAQPAVTPAP